MSDDRTHRLILGLGVQLEQMEQRTEARFDALLEWLHARFEQIDRRFEQIDRRFDEERAKTDAQFAAVYARFDEERAKTAEHFELMESRALTRHEVLAELVVARNRDFERRLTALERDC